MYTRMLGLCELVLGKASYGIGSKTSGLGRAKKRPGGRDGLVERRAENSPPNPPFSVTLSRYRNFSSFLQQSHT
jgi:hypothetical protein